MKSDHYSSDELKMYIKSKCSGMGRGGGVGGVGGGGWYSLQTAVKNLANKYFHFGQFLILSSVV